MELSVTSSTTTHRGISLRCILQTDDNARILAVRWSPNGQYIASVSADNLIRIWNASSGALEQTLIGHNRQFVDASWYEFSKRLVTISANNFVAFWDDTDGSQISNVQLRLSEPYDQILSTNGKQMAVVSRGGLISVWETTTLSQLHDMSGHSRSITRVAWSPDTRFLASASRDATVRVWEIVSGKLICEFKEHSDEVSDVTWSTDGNLIASASRDSTIKLWSFERRELIGTLEGHRDHVKSISFSHDSAILSSKSLDNSVILWRCDTWQPIATFDETSTQSPGPNISFNPKTLCLMTFDKNDSVVRVWELDSSLLLGMAPQVKSVRYRNAKVVLVGDTGVGKTGLGKVLAGEKFKATKSTHGRYVRRLDRTHHQIGNGQEEIRELLLWDLAGQPEFRLVHQLSLDQASVAVVLFDGSSATDPFKGVEFWSKALRQAKGHHQLTKFLVAARVDVSTLSVSDERMNRTAMRFQFARTFRTSAYTGQGVKDLLDEIKSAVNWESLPFNVSEHFFKEARDFVLDWKRRGELLKTESEIRRSFQAIHFSETFSDADFSAVLERIEAHDLIKIFSFGGYILLVPELLDNYAASMASAARKQPDGLGYLDEQSAREGWFDFGTLERVGSGEERIILQSAVEMFIEKELAISEDGRLIFPSQFNRELPEHPEVEGTTVSYRFEGALLNVYATLAVRLYHSEAFTSESLWKNAALFLPFGRTRREFRCGFVLREAEEGTGVLTVFFGSDVVDDTKILFLKYIHEHLSKKTVITSLRRERIFRCQVCLNEVRDRKAVQSRLDRGLPTIPCVYCEKATEIPLVDLIEQTFGKADRFLAKVREMDELIDERVDNASKESILVGRVMTIVSEAGQIFRPTIMHDWGIDGEIEFKDDEGKASGERLYVQLKSGKSHLKVLKNGTTTFRIPKARHIEYWQKQKYPVYLVILDRDNKIFWMNVSEYLSSRRNKKSQTIPFNAAEFTVDSIIANRSLALAQVSNLSASPAALVDSLIQPSTLESFDVFVGAVGDDRHLIDFVVRGLQFLEFKSYVCDTVIEPGIWFKKIVAELQPRIKGVIIALSTPEIPDGKVLQLRSFVSQCVEAKIPILTVVPKNIGEVQENLSFLRQLGWVEFGDRFASKTAFEKIINALIVRREPIN